jgi:hypothetical protein
MDKKVKLTYIYLLGFKFNIDPAEKITSDIGKLSDLIRAELKSEQYHLSITDVVDFIKEFKPGIPKCLMK